jgi:hypothetical protein
LLAILASLDLSENQSLPSFSLSPSGYARSEVSFSETTLKLERDIAWWINGSKGEVRVGITIDIKRGSHSIEIKSWTPELDPSLRNIHVTAGGRQVIDRHIEIHRHLE